MSNSNHIPSATDLIKALCDVDDSICHGLADGKVATVIKEKKHQLMRNHMLLQVKFTETTTQQAIFKLNCESQPNATEDENDRDGHTDEDDSNDKVADKDSKGKDKDSKGKDKDSKGKDKDSKGKDKDSKGKDKGSKGKDKGSEGKDKGGEGEDKDNPQ
ncbi:hypothetical protein CVT25_007629 [Psilocybe cyanescens]|uniref:Uncharacterized protein n=1 Tax=Psilocybe cyanescens TaxID=93625 RepID=A0A409XSW0_PSICY|nr:hypothetical protein CVT25_007629 [Psilocybe cyanescens]